MIIQLNNPNIFTDLTLPIGAYGRVVEIINHQLSAVLEKKLNIGDIVIQTVNYIYEEHYHGKKEFTSVALYNITTNWSGFPASYWRSKPPINQPYCRLKLIRKN